MVVHINFLFASKAYRIAVIIHESVILSSRELLYDIAAIRCLAHAFKIITRKMFIYVFTKCQFSSFGYTTWSPY